jgi:hypothetical protein
MISGTSILDITDILSNSRGHLRELLHVAVFHHESRKAELKEKLLRRCAKEREKGFNQNDGRGKRGNSSLIYLSQDFTFHISTDQPYQEQPRNTPSARIASYQVTKTS